MKNKKIYVPFDKDKHQNSHIYDLFNGNESLGVVAEENQYIFDIDDVANIMHTLFRATPAGSLQKWEVRHYRSFVQSLIDKS